MQSCNHRPIPYEHVPLYYSYVATIDICDNINNYDPPNSLFPELSEFYAVINIHENCSPNYPMRVIITVGGEGKTRGEVRELIAN